MAVTVMILSFFAMILLTVPVAFAIALSATIGLALSGVAPLLVVPDHSRVPQDLEVLADRRPADGHVPRELRHRARAHGQAFDDRPAAGVAQQGPRVQRVSRHEHVSYNLPVAIATSDESRAPECAGSASPARRPDPSTRRRTPRQPQPSKKGVARGRESSREHPFRSAHCALVHG